MKLSSIPKHKLRLGIVTASIAIVLAIALSLAIGIGKLWPILARLTGTGRGYTRNMEPVQIAVQNSLGEGVVLAVPEAYMHWRDNRRGGFQTQVVLTAMYPGMTPYSLISKEEHERILRLEFVDDPLRTDIYMTIGSALPDSLVMTLAYIKNSKYTTDKGATDEFHWYQQNIGSTTRDYLVLIAEEQQPKRMFECVPFYPGKKLEKQQVKCEVKVQVADRLMVSYSVPRRLLRERWLEIDNAAMKLFASFVSGCFKGDKLEAGDSVPESHACALPFP